MSDFDELPPIIEPSDEKDLIEDLLASMNRPQPESPEQKKLNNQYRAACARVPEFFGNRMDRLLTSYEATVEHFTRMNDAESAETYVQESNYLLWLLERLQREYATTVLKHGERALSGRFLIVGYEQSFKPNDSHIFALPASGRDYAHFFKECKNLDSYVLVLHSYESKNGAVRNTGLIANPPAYAQAMLEQKNATAPVIFPSLAELAQAEQKQSPSEQVSAR